MSGCGRRGTRANAVFPFTRPRIWRPEGLVLGAGTVLVPAHGARRLTSLDGQEARVLALLSAAYGKAVAPGGAWQYRARR